MQYYSKRPVNTLTRVKLVELPFRIILFKFSPPYYSMNKWALIHQNTDETWPQQQQQQQKHILVRLKTEDIFDASF